jgi:hypothetical protein
MTKTGLSIPMAVVLISLLFSAECQAVEVLAACKQPSPPGTAILLDLACRSEEDCWADPDDVDLVYPGGEISGWAIDDMVWIGRDGKAARSLDEGYPARAIWVIRTDDRKPVPDTVMLSYSDEPLTPYFTLKNGCHDMPAAALKVLGVQPT